MGRDNSSLKRRGATRSPKQKLYIVCEGKNTEPAYFRSLARMRQGLIEVYPVGGVGVASSVVDHAINLRKKLGIGKRLRQDSFEKRDEVWAVFDRDEHPDYEAVRSRCVEAGVGLAYSDPCFELWLILHLELFDRSYDRHQIQRHLEDLRPEYQSQGSKTCDFPALLQNIESAESRADILMQRRLEEGNAKGCPSTSVYKLTERIRGIEDLRALAAAKAADDIITNELPK